MAEQQFEALEDFKASFAYGSRTDLNFKFLKSLIDAEAAEFLRRALELLSDAADVGEVTALVEHWYRAQIEAYEPAPDAEPRFKYDDAPWASLGKPLAEARIAIVTAGGVYVGGDDPMGADGPTQAEVTTQIGESLRGEPLLSTIPRDTPSDRLCVRHPGYDVRAARLQRSVSDRPAARRADRRRVVGRDLTGLPCVRGTHRAGPGRGRDLDRGDLHPCVPAPRGEP